MISLLCQGFVLLLLPFLIGLPLGDLLAHRVHRWIKSLRPSQPERSTLIHVVTESQPGRPAALPLQDVATPFTLPYAAVAPLLDDVIFPVSSFGFATRSAAPRGTPRPIRLSPLAGAPLEMRKHILSRTRFSQEPERLWHAEGMPDDLTHLTGLTAEDMRQFQALGIYHLWQIAQWQPSHVLWIAKRLRHPQRIVNDDWIGQAANLTMGLTAALSGRPAATSL